MSAFYFIFVLLFLVQFLGIMSNVAVGSFETEFGVEWRKITGSNYFPSESVKVRV